LRFGDCPGRKSITNNRHQTDWLLKEQLKHEN
jgi:hypothetical protein